MNPLFFIMMEQAAEMALKCAIEDAATFWKSYFALFGVDL